MYQSKSFERPYVSWCESAEIREYRPCRSLVDLVLDLIGLLGLLPRGGLWKKGQGSRVMSLEQRGRPIS